MKEIKEYLEQRIKELNQADTEFCKDRWDMSKPNFERTLAREMSNSVTMARQELEKVLKMLSTTTEAKIKPLKKPYQPDEYMPNTWKNDPNTK